MEGLFSNTVYYLFKCLFFPPVTALFGSVATVTIVLGRKKTSRNALLVRHLRGRAPTAEDHV